MVLFLVTLKGFFPGFVLKIGAGEVKPTGLEKGACSKGGIMKTVLAVLKDFRSGFADLK